jgi:Holin of 3TMs, for gene-transfer release
VQGNWRPFIGWVCGAALAFDTIAKPVIIMAWVMAGHNAPVMPNLSTEQLYGLLFGLLGLGSLRTIEKVKA